MSAYSVGGMARARFRLLSYFIQCILHGAPGRAGGAWLAGLWYDSSSVREASGPRKEHGNRSSPTFFQPDVRMTGALLKGGRCADPFSGHTSAS